MTKSDDSLPPELRRLVRKVTDALGKTISEAEGEAFYEKIDLYRQKLKKRRGKKSNSALPLLLRQLEAESPESRIKIAHSFSLLLELINACETAYRTWRQQHKALALPSPPASAPTKPVPKIEMTYVLTAHPTEARSKGVLSVLKRLTAILIEGLQNNFVFSEAEIMTQLRILWEQPLVKTRAPTVVDEAEYIYSMLFSQPLFDFIVTENQNFDLKFRTWVGGDKDGHPGVNAEVMMKCLAGSRKHLIRIIEAKLDELALDLRNLAEVGATATKNVPAWEVHATQIEKLKSELQALLQLNDQDGVRLGEWKQKYEKFLTVGGSFIQRHYAALRINRLFEIFPACVLPLELREDADEIAKALTTDAKTPVTAIAEMLAALKKLSEGGDLRCYARGLVISHCESGKDLTNGVSLVDQFAGESRLPVIPLFESGEALLNGSKILKEWLSSKDNLTRIRANWQGQFEIMLGYSDSSKQVGVLPSRYLIRNSMVQIDKVIRASNLTPVFFHGSGGSVARGGGSLREQIAWWPNTAIARPKLTVQGEMIQRLFATKEILSSQATHLSTEAQARRKRSVKITSSKTMDLFVREVQDSYVRLVSDSAMLSNLMQASPYAYLEVLKIGSRPTARPSTEVSTSSLRAIPWVLCWTQTRLLMPSWWGTGSAWKTLKKKQKAEMKSLYRTDPFLSSYIKTLGFTLAKVELQIWEEYVRATAPEHQKLMISLFRGEFERTEKFLQEITGQSEPLWYRPWLQESIRLRSPYIHILNLLQIHAMKQKDELLLKETLVGIASGMLTTG